MANPFQKGWKYLMQSLDAKIDENADPKVQIQQAVAEAKKRHQEISKQAASIIGNRNQLQMKLDRLIKSQEDLQNKARTAIQASDKAAASGDAQKAQEFGSAAEVIASQLVSVEQELEQTKTAYSAAEKAAAEAQQQQKQSEARLQEQLSEVSKLESQIDQTLMQEQTARTMDSINQFGGDDNVPTLDGVREKIERRYASALGAQELAQDSVSGRMAEIETSGTDIAASNRLAEIRASMGGGEIEAGAAAGELDSGEDSTQERPHNSAQDSAHKEEAGRVDDALAEAEAYIEADKDEDGK
ncbi:PspA/IM30 family protein [Corynebacterium timonense]|uniref:Phage shock protein A n=1 Tax=Corynebacterium timonense TaxID=441500 RepID=A0A1H1UUV0_9CORY|nr:PspA/IM30 family protein [Corynebacterium timonense]SDS76255.1 Phage shock protein A [Corynebacterium timonense]